jgi:hypothetical protein
MLRPFVRKNIIFTERSRFPGGKYPLKIVLLMSYRNRQADAFSEAYYLKSGKTLKNIRRRQL